SDGRIDVWISTDENMVQVIVMDNGCGVAEEDKAQIFEPFYRVDKARSRASGGSGLGLTFCKKIVEVYKGEICVESEVEKGTRFIINLPFDNQKEIVS
ncbi:MAG: sensor histidine kinase, partial [Agathobacter sp.]|nr:sensor histidine kinase [Agathobacter sp.]